jgi:hypothetical protein
MKLLDALRGHPTDATRGDAGETDGETLPIAGYDRLGQRQVIGKLSGCSQQGLAAIEAHERAHAQRAPILDKLRYLRGSEPLPGYDALDSEQIAVALDDSDLATAKRVREYERKFQRRAAVLDAVTRTHEARQTASSSTSARREGRTPPGG